MNLFTRNSPYYHLLKYLLFLPKQPLGVSVCVCVCVLYIYIYIYNTHTHTHTHTHTLNLTLQQDILSTSFNLEHKLD